LAGVVLTRRICLNGIFHFAINDFFQTIWFCHGALKVKLEKAEVVCVSDRIVSWIDHRILRAVLQTIAPSHAFSLIHASKNSPAEILIPWKFENLFFNDENSKGNLQSGQKMKSAFCNWPPANCLLAYW
jgi:hypothetical protein